MATDLLERVRSRFPEGGAVVRRLGLALHSLRAVPPEALGEGLQVAERLGANSPIHIHVAEQIREVAACLTWSGARPIDWLLDHAPVDARWCLVHATHATSEELARVARSGALIGLCPTTEANLGDGVFPLREYLENDGAFGIGSDSHVSRSPAEEMRWLEYGQRLVSGARNLAAGFPHPSTGRTLLEGVLAGARATGTRSGALEVGAMADWVVLDVDHPCLTGREEDQLVDSWVFTTDASPVRDVVVGGRVVVRDGRHPREDEVLERYRRTMRRLLS
jgi:formimidoylglutamate deiminase